MHLDGPRWLAMWLMASVALAETDEQDWLRQRMEALDYTLSACTSRVAEVEAKYGGSWLVDDDGAFARPQKSTPTQGLGRVKVSIVTNEMPLIVDVRIVVDFAPSTNKTMANRREEKLEEFCQDLQVSFGAANCPIMGGPWPFLSFLHVDGRGISSNLVNSLERPWDLEWFRHRKRYSEAWTNTLRHMNEPRGTGGSF